MKSKPADLSERVDAIFEESLRISKESLRISKEAKDIEIRKGALESAGGELDKSVGYVKNSMRKGEQLDDRFLDYAFYHYGSEADKKKVREVKKFFTDFSKYSNQLILENCEGYSWADTMKEGEEERTILLGRLQEDAYTIEMPHRSVKAVTNNLKTFKKSEGWRNAQEDLLLNDFIYKLGRDSIGVIGLSEILEKMHPSSKSSLPKGIYMDLFSPIEKRATFGRSLKYDSEPHHSLIVGDEAVRHYLEEQNLEVVIQSVSSAKIPNI